MTQNNTSWTPGPWELELPDEWPFPLRVAVTIGGEEKRTIVDQPIAAYSSRQKTRQDARDAVGWDADQVASIRYAVARQEADLRLIAKAPEMAELLKALTDALKAKNPIHAITDVEMQAHKLLAEINGDTNDTEA